MAGLQLENREPPRGDTDAHYEDQMPTHVIWGDVESAGTADTSEFSSNQASDRSSQGTGSKKKIKNKRLPLRNENILFRRDAGGSSAERASSASSADRVTRPVNLSNARPSDLEIASAIKGLDSPRPADDQVAGGYGQAEAEAPQVGLLEPVRLNEQGEPTSVGSAGHDQSCKPCLFVHSKVGCRKGVMCEFCHFKHNRRSRPRPCKGKRNRYRKLLNRLEAGQQAEDGGSSDESSDSEED